MKRLKYILAVALLIGPTAGYWMGLAMNATVMAVNGSQMPVEFPPDVVQAAGIDNVQLAKQEIENEGMPVHKIADANTRLRFLDDWIVIRHLGYASPGDLFEWQYDVTFVPCLMIFIGLLLGLAISRRN